MRRKSELDQRRLFDTNYWGVVYGSIIAADHLSSKGGAIINIGSALSDRAVPIQGVYSASKHAIKGFTDALRMELDHDGAPVSVTLIKPAAINTPYTEHAKNYLAKEPAVPPPVYAPAIVAEAILYAAENAVRDLFVGGGAKALSMAGYYAPSLTDRMLACIPGDGAWLRVAASCVDKRDGCKQRIVDASSIRRGPARRPPSTQGTAGDAPDVGQIALHALAHQ